RKAEKRGPGGGHAVHNGIYAVLLEVDAAFVVAGSVAVEAGGDQLLRCRVGQHVARDLLDDELVERQVAVERLEHPVAILPNLAPAVDGVAIGIGATGEMEPVPAPALAVMR